MEPKAGLIGIILGIIIYAIYLICSTIYKLSSDAGNLNNTNSSNASKIINAKNDGQIDIVD